MTESSTATSSSLLSGVDVPSVLGNAAWSELSSTYTLRDPHTGDPLYQVKCVDPSQAAGAVDSAAKAFKTWKDTSPFTRRAIFLKALGLLEQRKNDFIQLAIHETTANGFWAQVDYQLCWNLISETAALATALRGEIAPAEDGMRAYVERIPYGVVFGIAPWNAPLILGVRAFANAIMAGNTVVLKSSEYSPKIHTWAAQLFVDAGLPPGVLNVVHVDPKDAPAVCEAIIRHRAVGKVNFTGSTFVGSKIAETAARHLKPCCLELGGKAPIVVLEDANLAAAANAAMFAGFSHSGQVCMAADSLIVHENVADRFVDLLKSHLSSRSARARDESPMTYRGLFNQASADKVNGLVEDAIQQGARLVAGSHHRTENIVQPVVLQGTSPSMKISSEEIFGPAMILNTFTTKEQAIEMANSSDYGLAASVYGANENECFAVARQILSGQVHINSAPLHDAQVIPHGGLKKSGYGRFNGLEGLREFTTIRTITFSTPHDQYPM